MQIEFLGAAQTVTGSKYLIRSGKNKILVDCGLFQGFKELRTKNWESFPVNPADIDFVLLTHAHIDHSGYIPLLVKNGFHGKIICSEATLDLCRILLPDSGYLQEEEARYANKKGYSRHKPALPLYTKEEAEIALDYFQSVPFDEKIALTQHISAIFYYGGHILGASFVKLFEDNQSILFSGDLGRSNDPIMFPPKDAVYADYFVIESTYGDRLHPDIDPSKLLASVINKTVKQGGVVVIPAFAVGRAQAMLYYLYELKKSGAISNNIPVFVDSPMATDATKLFYKYQQQHRLSESEAMAVCRSAEYMHTKEESMSLNSKNMPMIIISASGMASGGRVLHHIKNFGASHRNSIIFCGYQAGGTRGEQMVHGAKAVKIFGQEIQIHAKVVQLDNMSAHADYSEMLNWLSHIKQSPKKIFITHGELNASLSLKEKIEERFSWRCKVPEQGYSETLV